jgi:hypothetical protein
MNTSTKLIIVLIGAGISCAWLADELPIWWRVVLTLFHLEALYGVAVGEGWVR